MKNLLVLTTAALGWCAVWASSANAAPATPACRDPYTCPKVYAPICDGEGRVYSNRCMMESAACQDGVPRIETPCPRRQTRATSSSPASKVVDCKSPFVCPKIYAPVCDDEGRIYSNLCMMQSASCDDGKPRVETPCPKPKREAETDKESPRSVGEEEEGRLCRKRCFKILTPVCGDDGLKYGNKCLLDYQACKTDREIKVVDCSTRKTWKMWVDEEEEEEEEDM